MVIRAVGKRCGVVLQDLNIPLSEGKMIELLAAAGFWVLQVSIVELARSRIGQSTFMRKAQARDAPDKVDCSSFVKWLYGEKGVWIPRRTIQQWSSGTPIGLQDVGSGDLVFTKGRHTFYTDEHGNEIGHVGLVTDDGTVIHAANSQDGVIEVPIARFCKPPNFVGARRLAPFDRLLTLQVPESRDVETSDDLRWILLSSQTRK